VSDPRPALIGDIGGTNARFALAGADGEPTRVRILATADYPGLAAAAQAYLDLEQPDPAPDRAAIAVASPVLGDRVSMTNRNWSFSISELRAALGLAALRVVNDFTAQALALPLLDDGETRRIGSGKAVPGAPIAILGPGTGLGVSGAVEAPDGSRITLATEGGHATIAPVGEREQAVVGELARRFGHVSIERAVSGPGLGNLAAAIAAVDGLDHDAPEPSEITARALAGSDPVSVEALSLFCAMLGGAAGNLALTLGARGGVYIGGGIARHIGDFLAASAFRARFEDKGRFRDYLSAIPTCVIMAENPALRGLTALLEPDAGPGR
jgi:glucokinase